MKEIFPSSNNKTITSEAEKPITEQQYEDLVTRTNTAVSCADAAKSQAINIQNQVNNGTITPNKVVTSCVEADAISATTVCSSDLKTHDLYATHVANISAAAIGSLDVTGSSRFVGQLTAPRINTSRIDVNGHIQATSVTGSQLVTGIDGSFDTLHVAAEARVGDLIAETISLDNSHIGCLTGTSATIECVSSDEIGANKLNATSLTANESTSPIVNSNYITHLYDPQEINGGTITDYYILLPLFTNGNYFLEARNDGGNKLWSVELTNSINNIQMRWSTNDLDYLQDLKYAVDASNVVKVQLHIKAFEHLSLFRQSQSTDNTLPPSIYTVDQLPQSEIFNITEYKGTFIQDIIFTNKLNVKELQMDSLILKCGGFTEELLLTCGYDSDGKPIPVRGCDNQYVSNQDLGCGLVPTWKSPTDIVSITHTHLITSKGVALYDGETEEGNYPIKHLGDTTCVHGALNVGSNLTVNGNFKSKHIYDDDYTSIPQYGTALAFTSEQEDTYNTTAFEAGVRWYDEDFNRIDQPDSSWTQTSSTDIGSLKALHDLAYVQYGSSWYKVTGFGLTILYESTPVSDTTIINELEDTSRAWVHVYRKEYTKEVSVKANIVRINSDATQNPVMVRDHRDDWTNYNQKPVVYDSAKDTFRPVCHLDLPSISTDELEAGNATIQNDLVVGHDLYVRGTTHTVEEETLSTGSDSIVLRQNNNTSLASGELAGIIVNKYNGTENLAIGTGNDGQLRIGHPSGTSVSYGTVYFKDSVWYDSDKTTVITPQGELTSYASKSIDADGYTKYTSAVFTIFDYTQLQPVLTREEESNITDNALLKFNKTTHRAEDIATPTASEQTLTSVINNGNVSYQWTSKQPGVYCFATMADYNAYTGNIPIGSTVIIDECNNYLASEVIA